MSNKKDTVREDLRAALDVWLQNHPGRSLAVGYLADGYLAGHGDGWNRCLDVVRGLLTDWNAIIGFSPSDYKSMQEELEKLRR